MGLRRFGHSELLRVVTGDFIFSIYGSVENHLSCRLDINVNQPAVIDVSSEYYNDNYDLFVVSSEGALIDNNKNFTMLPTFFEDRTYEVFLEKRPESQLDDLRVIHLSNEITNCITNRGKSFAAGVFTFDEEIGESTFYIENSRKTLMKVTIEVFPTKIDYRKDYFEMIKEINEEIVSLAFDFLGKTAHKAGVRDSEFQTSVEYISILQTIWNGFIKALNRIEKHPKHNLICYEQLVRSDRATGYSNKTREYLRKNPSSLVQLKGGIEMDGISYVPEKVYTTMKETSFDIFENRYVKFILISIVSKIRKVKENLKKIDRRSNSTDAENMNDKYFEILHKFQKAIEVKLKCFYKNIGNLNNKKTTTLVFQMASGYKEVYKYYLMLKKGLNICEDIYNIPPKKIWKLYEIWCYVKLNKILQSLGYEIAQFDGILKTGYNGLSLSLLQNKNAIFKYTNTKGDEIDLWYNRSYNNLPTTNQRPDNVLCIRNKSSRKGFEKVYIFDAKYRVCADERGNISPLDDDINVMHRYRDSIVVDMKNEAGREGYDAQFEYSAFGAYVMFPFGGDENTFKQHKFYKSIDSVNIGALPMLPRKTDLITEHLKKILEQSDVESLDEIIPHSKYDDNYRFLSKNVMVVAVSDPSVLNDYISNSYFKIHSSRLSKIKFGTEYIAFYESKKRFQEAGIRYFGKIKSFSTIKEMDNSSFENEYLYFDLEIQKMLKIKSDTSVVPLFYSTLYLLENAENITELMLCNKREIEIYGLLKDISRKSGIQIKKIHRHGKFKYKMERNVIEILNDGKIKLNSSVVGFKELKNRLLSEMGSI